MRIVSKAKVAWVCLAGSLGVGLIAFFHDFRNRESVPESASSSPIIANPVIVRSFDSKSQDEVSESTLLDQLKNIDAETDIVQRQASVASLVSSIPDDEIESELGAVAGATGNAGLEFQASLVRRWAEKEPAEAAAWSVQLHESPLARIAQKEVALAWAESDLPAALNWAQQIPEEDVRETVLATLGYEAARQDPLQALQVGLALKSDRERQDLVIYAANQWAAQDPEAASRWVLSLDRTEDWERLLSGITVATAELAPEHALRLAIDELSAGELQNTVVISILQRWAQRNPVTAAAWVEQFHSEPLGMIASRNLVDIWSELSWDEPAQWLVNLADADLRDAGVSLLARKLAVVDTANATEWVKIITDPVIRESTHAAISEIGH